MKLSTRGGVLGAAVASAIGVIVTLPTMANAAVDPNDPTATYVSVQADGTLNVAGGWAYVNNHITLTPMSGGRVRVTDVYPIHDWAPDCLRRTDYEYECGRSGPITGLFINGNLGDDLIVNNVRTSNLMRAKLYGGAGNDTVYGGPGSQWVFGGYTPDDLRTNRGVPDNGNDQLFGGCEQECADDTNDILEGSDGNDSLNGGAGTDDLRGSTGVDSYAGGSGEHDSVSYIDEAKGMRLSINGIADDGVPSLPALFENIPLDVEDVYGGWGPDTIVGSDKDNMLHGGNGGGDKLHGEGGNDRLYGYTGWDTIYGGFGDDDMFGGEGDDQLFGSFGFDEARELLGEGNDTCEAEVHPNCETVKE